jgi:hypothetical protein
VSAYNNLDKLNKNPLILVMGFVSYPEYSSSAMIPSIIENGVSYLSTPHVFVSLLSFITCLNRLLVHFD